MALLLGEMSVRAEEPVVEVLKFDRDRDGVNDVLLSNVNYGGGKRMMVYQSRTKGYEEVAHFVNGQIVSLERKKIGDDQPYEIITYSLVEPKVVMQMVTYDPDRNIYVPADAAAIAKHQEELKGMDSFFNEMFQKTEKKPQ